MVSRSFNKSSSPTSTEPQRNKISKSHRVEKPPRRPMTSYNIFFLLERERIVGGFPERKYTTEDAHNIVALHHWKETYCKRKHRKSHGKISFKDLSIVAAANWRRLDAASKQVFYDCATAERTRHANELHSWKINQTHNSNGNAFSPSHHDVKPKVPDPIPVASQENTYFEYSLDMSLHKLRGYSERMSLFSSAIQCQDARNMEVSSDILLTCLDRIESLDTVDSWIGNDENVNVIKTTELDNLFDDHNAIVEDDATMASFQDFWAV